MSHENIYQHFHPEEKQFIDRVLDWMKSEYVIFETSTTRFINLS